MWTLCLKGYQKCNRSKFKCLNLLNQIILELIGKLYMKRGGLSQGALNTWRWRLRHFLQLLYNQKIQKVILIWFVHLLKSNKFLEVHMMAQEISTPRPFKVWNSFGRKSILNVARGTAGTKFGRKLNSYELNDNY